MGIYKQNFDYTYSLDEDILILNTGHGQYKIKIENNSVLENIHNIATLATKELQAIEEKQSVCRNGLSHYAKLLLATLNICEKYTKLEKKYKDIRTVLESIQTLKSDLKRTTVPSAPPPSSVSGQRVHVGDQAGGTGKSHLRKRPLAEGRTSPATTAPPPALPAKPDNPAAVGQGMSADSSAVKNNTITTSCPSEHDKEKLRVTTSSSPRDPAMTPSSTSVSNTDKTPDVSPTSTAGLVREQAGASLQGRLQSSSTCEFEKDAKRMFIQRPPGDAGVGNEDYPTTQEQAAARPDALSATYETKNVQETCVTSVAIQQNSSAETSVLSGEAASSNERMLPIVKHQIDNSSSTVFTPSQASDVPAASALDVSQAGPEVVNGGDIHPASSANTPIPEQSMVEDTSKNSETREVQVHPEQTGKTINNLSGPPLLQAVLVTKESTEIQSDLDTPPLPPTVVEASTSSSTEVPNKAIETADVSDQDVERSTGYLYKEEENLSRSLERVPEHSVSLSPDAHEAELLTDQWRGEEIAHADQLVPQHTLDSLQDEYQLPLLSFLKSARCENQVDQNRIRTDAELLETKLGYFGIKGEVMGIHPGPVITTYEYKPDPGIKISKIVNLADDLALALSAYSIRIVAPIPGKDVMGIEIPNIQKSLVPFIDIVTSDAFNNSTSKIPICLGKDIVGNPVVVKLESMPHLLIAGATGTGKSVGLNAMITSILYKATPDEVRFLMIDPKRIELSFYNDIPHLLTPVITDMNKANIALQWLVREMDRRYNLLAQYQVRHIEQFNQKLQSSKTDQYDDNGEILEPMPYIVVIIDELADLMMTASRDIEFSLTRLAQMARAAGIHLILATQRPSVDVLTGIIKANFPTRISFQVSSKTDSRTIIDSNGAETLLGNGDMLFVPPGTARLMRVHGTYVSEEELVDITSFIKQQRKPNYIFNVLTEQESDDFELSGNQDEYDEKYNEALEFVLATRQASISGVQRALRVGYNRAARIVDLMEKNGVVGPSDGIKPRKVLINSMNMM